MASGYPVVVLIHGGGWRSGSRSHLVPMDQRPAAAGYVTVPVEYRMALEARYPASILDTKSAIRWLREPNHDYPIDPDKIAVLGCSSGAQVATLIGMTNSDVLFDGLQGEGASADMQAIINIDGVVSFIHPEAEAEIKGDSASTWLGARCEEQPGLWKEASPLEYFGPKSPPMLFVNSSIPRFHAGRDDVIKQLDQYGIHNEVHTLENTPHPFWLLNPWFDPTVACVEKFLDHVFKSPAHR
jgi:acetyl esterase/lipase